MNNKTDEYKKEKIKMNENVIMGWKYGYLVLKVNK